MVDKYAHLAPRRPRECYRDDGVPKRRYTEAVARLVAEQHEGYHAYKCSTCGSWHTGSEK